MMDSKRALNQTGQIEEEEQDQPPPFGDQLSPDLGLKPMNATSSHRSLFGIQIQNTHSKIFAIKALDSHDDPKNHSNVGLSPLFKKEAKQEQHKSNMINLKAKNLGNVLGKQMIIKVLEEEGIEDMKDDKKPKKNAVFNYHGKVQKYDVRSLFLFKQTNPFRRGLVWLTTSKYFEFLIIMIIIMNTISMSAYDYADRDESTLRNQIISAADYVFTAIFALEAIMKIIGMGFVKHKHSYIRDPWNVIDFLVVILGLLSILPGIPNLKALRAIRVFKPLRTINTIPGMKILVSSLLQSIPQMWNVVIFLSFVILIFSILGVQTFQGAQYFRCRLTEVPVSKNYWPIDPDQSRMCGGAYTCNEGTFCGAPHEYNISLKYDNVTINPLISYGLSNFDNVIRGMQFIFCMMTMDAWTQDMYNYMDANIPWFAAIYFPLMVIIMAFILLNYFLAIIMSTFNIMSEEKKEQEIRQRSKDQQIQKLMAVTNKEIEYKKDANMSEMIGGFMFQQTKAVQEAQQELDKSNANDIKKQIFKLSTFAKPPQPETTNKGGQKEPEQADDQEMARKKESNEEDFESDPFTKDLMNIVQSLISVQARLETRAKSNCYYKICYKVIQNNWFQVIIVSSIIANTICLALDSYPPDLSRDNQIEKLNYIFFGIFFLEMILKIGGLGFKYYASDKFNVLDSVIVIFSVIDIITSFAFENVKSGQKAILAFRAFRLLRVFKLAKNWKKFQYLLKTIGDSLLHMGSFAILLLVFITIYILFGMEIFAHEVKFSSVGVIDLKNGETPQINCDDYLNSFLTLFIVLTQEGWREIMYQFYIAKGSVSYLYFMSFLVMGQMILLNLFMAILLENFDISEKQETSPNKNDIENLEAINMMKSQNAFNERIKRVKACFKRTFCRCLEEKTVKNNKYHAGAGDESTSFQPRKIEEGKNDFSQDVSQVQIDENKELLGFNPSDQEEMTAEQIQRLKRKLSKKKQKDQEKKLKLQNRIHRIAMSRKTFGKTKSTTSASVQEQELGLKAILIKNFEEQIHEKYIKQKIRRTYEQHNIAKKINDYQGKSLFLLDTHNQFRKKLYRICKSKQMEFAIIGLIIVSSVMLAIDNPLNNPKDMLSIVMNYMDIGITCCFALESLLKIITFGLIINGPGSYLRATWNIVDFSVVVASIVSLSLASNENLNMIKIFRLFRVLRPIRMISKNEGLKISLSALILSVPGIINVIIIQWLFLLIFGIIGVSFFKGSFYSCYADPSSPLQSFADVDTIFDCLNIGGEWMNYDYNFDNILNAMVTLFNISTANQWVSNMQRAQGIVGPNMQPKIGNQSFWAFYYVVFIIIGNFFVWNLFVGVVISTFNSEKDRLGMNYLLKNKQKQWLNQKGMCLQYKPKRVVDSYESKVRELFRTICLSNAFEITIMVCIIINTVILCIDWYDAPPIIATIQEVSNYVFTGIFILEAIFKVIALGCKTYFHDRWNLFDFIVIVASLASIIVWNLTHLKFVRLATLIRTFRVARVFKLVKKAKKLKIIFDTFISALPALTNVGGLLMLFLFIYSIIGVFLFAELKFQTNIDVHNNFQNFGQALMVLVRSWTGEDWDSMMYDVSRQYSSTFQCSYDTDYESIQANGGVAYGCGTYFGYLYFISFTILIPYTFVNLFIAIIIQGLDDAMFQEKQILEERDMEHFKDIWSRFDKNGTGLIEIHNLPAFLLQLKEPLGWDATFQNDQKAQDNFLVDLNIDTYNNFKHYQFWDVLQGLTKIIFIHKMMDAKIKRLRDRDEDITEEEAQKIKFLFKMDLEFEYQNDLQKNILVLKEEIKKEKHLNKKIVGKRDAMYSSCQIKATKIIINAFARKKARRQAQQEIKTKLEQGLIGKNRRHDLPSNNQGEDKDIERLVNGYANDNSMFDTAKSPLNFRATKPGEVSNMLEELDNDPLEQLDQMNNTNSMLFQSSNEKTEKTFQPPRNKVSNTSHFKQLDDSKKRHSMNVDFTTQKQFSQLRMSGQNGSQVQSVEEEKKQEEEKMISEELDKVFEQRTILPPIVNRENEKMRNQKMQRDMSKSGKNMQLIEGDEQERWEEINAIIESQGSNVIAKAKQY